MSQRRDPHNRTARASVIPPMLFMRSLVGLLCMCGFHALLFAQSDTVGTLPWVGRNYQHWSGIPMSGGPNGECIAGYTYEESHLIFHADGTFQQIVFADRWTTLTMVWYGVSDACPTTLEGDTIALHTGRWVLASDTLHVRVMSTGLYPHQPFSNDLFEHNGEGPFRPSTPPARTCTSLRHRLFRFVGEAIWEGDRIWR